MRVLVCGGRDYNDRSMVVNVLTKLHVEIGVSCLIEGGARGADRMAREWAETSIVPIETYEADWECYGSFAGPKRNKVMLDEGKPDIVVAFPGGKGTRNMIRQARKHGVEVYEIDN